MKQSSEWFFYLRIQFFVFFFYCICLINFFIDFCMLRLWWIEMNGFSFFCCLNFIVGYEGITIHIEWFFLYHKCSLCYRLQHTIFRHSQSLKIWSDTCMYNIILYSQSFFFKVVRWVFDMSLLFAVLWREDLPCKENSSGLNRKKNLNITKKNWIGWM